MKLTDELFLKMTRDKSNGGFNAGMDLALPKDIKSHANNTGDMRENLYIMYALAVGCNARRILEIGVDDGTATLAFLKAVFEIDGYVTSVDVCDVPVAQAVIQSLELTSRWGFHKGNSHEVLKKFRAEGRQFDMIFVDGDHTYAGAKEDVEDAAAMLVENGMLITHDNWTCSISVDWTKPFGERATPGSAQLGHEMLTGKEWMGLVFPFGNNLGIFYRRNDCIGTIEKQFAAARKEGLIK